MDSDFRSVSKLKVQELRDLCKKRNLDSSGTKPILVQRLKDHIKKTQVAQGINEPVYSFSTDNSMEKCDSTLVDHDESTLSNDQQEHQDDEGSESEPSSYSDDGPMYVYSDQEESDYEEEMIPEDYEKVTTDNEDSQLLRKHDDNYHEKNSNLMDCQKNNNIEMPHGSFCVLPSSISNEKPTKAHKTKKIPIVPPSVNEPEIEAFENLFLDVRTDIFQLDSYNSDLNFVITDANCLQGCNLTKNGLSHFWCSSTTNYGIKAGCKYIRNLDVSLPIYEIPEHAIRIGFTTQNISHLGDSLQSIGFENNGKLYHNSKVLSSSSTKFGVNDVVGVFLDTTCDPAIFCVSVNGTVVSDAVGKLPFSEETVSPAEGPLEADKTKTFTDTLYPCIYFKNIEFSVNFKVNPSVQEKTDHFPIDSMETKSFIVPNHTPLAIDQCEMIMMSGILGCGKSTWVSKFLRKNSSKKYVVIGRTTLLDRWRVIGQHRKVRLSESVSASAIAKLLSLAAKRPCCCILDQSNCHSTSRERRMDHFNQFPSRKAVIIIPHLAEYELRISKAEQNRNKFDSDDRTIHESDIIRYKKAFTLPSLKEGFTEIIFDDSTIQEAKRVLNDYRYDADKLKELLKFKSQRKVLLDRVSYLNSKLRASTDHSTQRSASPTMRSTSRRSPRKSTHLAYSSRSHRQSRSPPPNHEFSLRNDMRRPAFQLESRGDIVFSRRHEEGRKRNAPPSMLPPLPPPPPPSTLPSYRGSSRTYMDVSPSRDSYRGGIVRTTYSSNPRDHPNAYQPNDDYDIERTGSHRLPNIDTTLVRHGYRTNPVDYASRASIPSPRESNRSSLNGSFGRDRYRTTELVSSRSRLGNTRNISGGYRSSNTHPQPITSSVPPENNNWNSTHYDTAGQVHRHWDSTRPPQSTKPRTDYGGFSEKSPGRGPRVSGRSSLRSRYT